jgi:hypothetical protein
MIGKWIGKDLEENIRDLCEISGSHGGEYEVQSLWNVGHLFDYMAEYPRRPWTSFVT